MGATLDGLVDPGGAVFEAKFMLPWTFSKEAAAEKHMAQLQQNMGRKRTLGRTVDHYRGREVGRNDRPCRPASIFSLPPRRISGGA